MAIQNFLEDQINTIFNECNQIILYNDEKKQIIKKGTPEFNHILQLWQITINNGYEMPAFGVSLHDLTLQDMKTGTHLEFVFDKTNYHNEMPFDSLLVKLIENQGGYELIRHHDNEYEGRCFYINTPEISNELFQYILKVK